MGFDSIVGPFWSFVVSVFVLGVVVLWLLPARKPQRPAERRAWPSSGFDTQDQ